MTTVLMEQRVKLTRDTSLIQPTLCSQNVCQAVRLARILVDVLHALKVHGLETAPTVTVHACLVGNKSTPTKEKHVNSARTILIETIAARKGKDNYSSFWIGVTSNVKIAILDAYYVMVWVTKLAQVIYVEVWLNVLRATTMMTMSSDVYALKEPTMM